MKKLLIILASVALVSTSVFAADTNNTANVHLTSVMTNLSSTAQVEIDAHRLSQARNGNSFNESIATSCAWTNQKDGNLNQRLSVSNSNYEKDGLVALYGIDSTNAGQKIPIQLFVSRANNPTLTGLQPLNTDVPLNDHADPNANASGCSNINYYLMYIAPTDLVKAKSGHYEVHFSITASNYTG